MNSAEAPSGILTESAPLLADPARISTTEQDEVETPSGSDDSSNYRRGFWALLLLTFPLGGLQVGWTVQQGSLAPHLLSLPFLSAPVISIIYLAGPVTGIFIQPLIGFLSTKSRTQSSSNAISTNRHGTPRTALLLTSGALLTALSLLILSFLPSFFSQPLNRISGVFLPILIALSIWTLDVGLNVVEIAGRILLVTSAPLSQQTQAAALAARTVGACKVLGFGIASLPVFFVSWGGLVRRFQGLSIDAGLLVLVGCGVAVVIGRSKRHNESSENESEEPIESSSGGEQQDPVEVFKPTGWFEDMKSGITRLSPLTRAVCLVQVWAWMGWFPFLFYGSTYVQQLYTLPRFDPELSPSEISSIREEGTRLGSLAMFTFAVSSLISSILLPFVIIPVEPKATALNSEQPRLYRALLQLSRRIQVIPLPRAWQLAHILSTLAYFSTFVLHSAKAGIVLGGVFGICWSLTAWAPYAILGVEIQSLGSSASSSPGYSDTAPDEREETDYQESAQSERQPPPARYESRAGVILGLHNVAISAPQILATLIAAVIFAICAEPDGRGGEKGGMPWIMRAAGVATMLAALYTQRVIRRVSK